MNDLLRTGADLRSVLLAAGCRAGFPGDGTLVGLERACGIRLHAGAQRGNISPLCLKRLLPHFITASSSRLFFFPLFFPAWLRGVSGSSARLRLQVKRRAAFSNGTIRIT